MSRATPATFADWQADMRSSVNTGDLPEKKAIGKCLVWVTKEFQRPVKN